MGGYRSDDVRGVQEYRQFLLRPKFWEGISDLQNARYVLREYSVTEMVVCGLAMIFLYDVYGNLI